MHSLIPFGACSDVDLSILSTDVLFFGICRQLVRPLVHDRVVSDCHGLRNESGTAGVLQGIRTDSYLPVCGCRAVSDIEKGNEAGKQIFLRGTALYGTRNTDVRRHDGRNVILRRPHHSRRFHPEEISAGVPENHDSTVFP